MTVNLGQFPFKSLLTLPKAKLFSSKFTINYVVLDFKAFWTVPLTDEIFLMPLYSCFLDSVHCTYVQPYESWHVGGRKILASHITFLILYLIWSYLLRLRPVRWVQSPFLKFFIPMGVMVLLAIIIWWLLIWISRMLFMRFLEQITLISLSVRP
jgi:hypothetical protein